MSGPLGVMCVLLLEAAVGGAVILWAAGVWGAVRRGFFLLTGATVALCAVGAWAIARAELPAAGNGAVLALLTGFAGLSVLWPLLLVAGQETVARLAGIAAAAVGVVALGVFGTVHDDPLAAVAALVCGAVFLGSTLYGLLLGHWYLVERRLDKRHMVRSAWWYIAGVVAAVGTAALSAAQPAPEVSQTFSPLLAVPGFSTILAGGLVAICVLIAAFVWKLAKEGGRSIQAATGYFYLAVIMAFSAELSAKIGFF